MAFLDKIIGNVPEVPVKVTIENDTIIKVSTAVLIVATLCFLIAALIKIKK